MIGPRFSRRPLISQGEILRTTHCLRLALKRGWSTLKRSSAPYSPGDATTVIRLKKGSIMAVLFWTRPTALPPEEVVGNSFQQKILVRVSCCTRFAIPTLIFRCLRKENCPTRRSLFSNDGSKMERLCLSTRWLPERRPMRLIMNLRASSGRFSR